MSAFLKRLAAKAGVGDAKSSKSSSTTRKTASAPASAASSTANSPHTAPLSGSASPPVMGSARGSLITIPQSLTLTAKPAAVPHKLAQHEDGARTAAAATKTQPPPVPKEYIAAIKAANANAPTPTHTGSIHVITAADGHGANGQQHSPRDSFSHGPSTPSVSASRSSKHRPSTSIALTQVHSSTNTNTTNTNTVYSSTSLPASMSYSTRLEGYFFPPHSLPSLAVDRFIDLVPEDPSWSLEDRLVYYVHMSSKIDSAKSHASPASVNSVEAWILDQIKPLCRKGVDINAKSTVFTGVYALISACYQGYLHVVRYLLSQGADVNVCSSEGFSCLMIAMLIDNMDLLREVLARKPSLEPVDALHQTALHIAVQRLNVCMVEKMLPSRTIAALNQQDEHGQTPLMIAVKKGSLTLVQLLVGAGSDAAVKDKNGLTAFDLHVSLTPTATLSGDDILIMRRILSPIPQLTLPYLSGAGYCTFWSTDHVPTVQANFYRCLTCDRSGLLGICDACHSHCHIGHTMVRVDASLRYYCGCGAGELRGELTLCASRPGQQYHTPDGQELDWPMGKLSDQTVRVVLLGLVKALGLDNAVINKPHQSHYHHHHRHHSHSNQNNPPFEPRESITFHPQMQLVDHDAIPVEWTETWLLAFPIIKVKLLWRFQGATARVSPHLYSIVSAYLDECNAQLESLSRENEDWHCGSMELVPDTGEISYVISYHAAADLIVELSPIIEYNHQLGGKMFSRLMPPLCRLLMTGNENVLGIGSNNGDCNNNYNYNSNNYTPVVQPSPSNQFSSPLTNNLTITPLPEHSHAAHSHHRSLDARDTDGALSASANSTDSHHHSPITGLDRHSPDGYSADGAGGNKSVSPSNPVMETSQPVARVSSVGSVASNTNSDDNGDVDLTPAALERLGFEVIPFSNLDLPTDPSLVRTGGGAVVIRGKTRSDETPIAMKMFHHQDELDYDQRLRKEFLDEATMLRKAAHSRIVQFMGVCCRPYGLITELLDTSLYDVLYVDRVHLTDLQRATIALEVCRGVAYLHGKSPPIIHRDIKSHNILLNRHLTTIKICDLGIARTKDALRSMVENGSVDGMGTVAWTAPEVLDLARNFNYSEAEKMDVYSIGCLLYEMVCERIPWSSTVSPSASATAASIIEMVQSGSRPTLSMDELMTMSAMPSIWYKLIDKCLSHEPSQRPAVFELVRAFTQIVDVCDREFPASSPITVKAYNHQHGVDIASSTPHSPIAVPSVNTASTESDSKSTSGQRASDTVSSATKSNDSPTEQSPQYIPRFHASHPPHIDNTANNQPTSPSAPTTIAVNGASGASHRRDSMDEQPVHLHFSPPSTPISTSVNSQQPLTPIELSNTRDGHRRTLSNQRNLAANTPNTSPSTTTHTSERDEGQ